MIDKNIELKHILVICDLYFHGTQPTGLQGQVALNIDAGESDEVEINRFEVLRNELIELEKRVQRSADTPNITEVLTEVTVFYFSTSLKIEISSQ